MFQLDFSLRAACTCNKIIGLAHFLFVIDTAQSNIHSAAAKGSYGIFLIFNLHDVLSRRQQRTMGVHLRRENMRAAQRDVVFSLGAAGRPWSSWSEQSRAPAESFQSAALS
jgi:hypothetical protein